MVTRRRESFVSGLIFSVIFLIAVAANAAPLRVVTTGDSITVGYGSSRLQGTFDQVGVEVDVFSEATGGITSGQYVGESLDPSGEYLDYTDLVLGHDPDAILFMLGTNDAYQSFWESKKSYIEDYQNRLGGPGGVFDRFSQAVNSRGVHPTIIVSSLIPTIRDSEQGLFANEQIQELLNPWIQSQAEIFGFHFLDLNTLIQQQPDWESLYNDGIHLWANDAQGYKWMANEWSDATLSTRPVAIPEPASLFLIAMGSGFLLRRKRSARL